MGDEGDAALQMERAQKSIEYILALVIPILIALMLYSYVLAEDLFQPLFITTVVVASLTVIPAYVALRLHYRCWSKNTMPRRLITGLIGIIYITIASVVGVSVLSTSKGLDPEQPLTFAVFGFLALMLIAILAYNSRYQEKYERSDIRFYRKRPEDLASEIKDLCASHQEDFSIVRDGKRTTVTLSRSKVAITIVPQAADSSEVMMDCADPVSSELCSVLKRSLDQEA